MYYRYTISDKSNTVAIMAWPYDNSDLQNYFEDEVVPKKEETRRTISALKADLEVLFSWIKYREPRLYRLMSARITRDSRSDVRTSSTIACSSISVGRGTYALSLVSITGLKGAIQTWNTRLTLYRRTGVTAWIQTSTLR